ncbi:MAG: MotA/TolQ/ExbB proton channel family protein [Verrucomicrobiales bacterium]|jgi:biopolymer transport protein ExbB|nr:MotA/TolQ/ExbB proton channel family protein [Verrucomicrobiales bacterium]
MDILRNIAKFFHDGGWAMVPLSLTSLVALAFILERGVALRRARVIPDYLYRMLLSYRSGQPLEPIAAMIGVGDSTMARLVRVCLEHLPWSKAENAEAVQVRARAEVVQLERGLVLLEIIVGIAPLLGLMGTVSGMIVIFTDVGHLGGAKQTMQMALGISQALNATVSGLAIAIPALIMHGYYSRKVEALAVEMESLCMDFLTKLYLQPATAGDKPGTAR